MATKTKAIKKRQGLNQRKPVYLPAEQISDAEFRRRLAIIDAWREKEFAAFKKEHPDDFPDQD